MNYEQMAVTACLGAIAGFWLAAYIYGKELGRTIEECRRQKSYIEQLRTRLESIQCNQRKAAR